MDFYDKNINTIKVLKKGAFKGLKGPKSYDYYIVSMRGQHPCAYVAVEEDDALYGVDLEGELYDAVHGGITYCQKGAKFDSIEDDRWIFGWDYAHAGDFTRMTLDSDNWGDYLGKKYSIYEIMKDIREMCKVLNAVNFNK